MNIEVDGKQYETDEEGYLVNLSDWSQAMAEQMVAGDGVELTHNHWEVINILEQYYQDYQLAPRLEF